jgi:hypothetical protein
MVTSRTLDAYVFKGKAPDPSTVRVPLLRPTLPELMLGAFQVQGKLR